MPMGFFRPRRNSTWAPSSWRVRSPIHRKWAEQPYHWPVRLSTRVKRLLVVRQQGLVAGVEVGLACSCGTFSGGDAAGLHEGQASSMRAASPRSARPAGCRRRTPGSTDAPCAGRRSRPGRRRAAGSRWPRPGCRRAAGASDRAPARPHAKVDAVDDVAAVARQLDAALDSRSGPSAAWRTGRPCGLPSPPGRRHRRSAPRPSAARRGRCRGWCWHGTRQRISAQSPPCSRKASPAATRASCAFRLRASPAKTSGGSSASSRSTASRTA